MKTSISCSSCGKPVFRIPSQLARSKSGRAFCSRSCAATANNSTSKKRTRINTCRTCNESILSNYAYCLQCYINKHHLSGKTLVEAIGNRKDANRYSGIRGNARNVYFASDKPKCCTFCGYDKHVEICHVKDIAAFSLDTLISIVNHIDNITCLCRNHHWEFDNGLLVMGPAGIEPAANLL